MTERNYQHPDERIRHRQILDRMLTRSAQTTLAEVIAYNDDPTNKAQRITADRLISLLMRRAPLTGLETVTNELVHDHIERIKAARGE